MDEKSRLELRELLKATHVASIATLRDGAPAVSMAHGPGRRRLGDPHSCKPPRTAHRDMLADRRVALMLVEAETSEKLPQALERVMIQGVAREIDRESSEYETPSAPTSSAIRVPR